MSDQNAWGAPAPSPASGVNRPASVLVAAADLATDMANAINRIPNLTVIAVATTPDDVRQRLVTLTPDVVVADGLIFQSATEVVAVLGSYPGVCMILLPQARTPEDERPLLTKGWMVGDREGAHNPDTYAPILERLADQRLVQSAPAAFSGVTPRPTGATRWAAVAVLGGQE